MDAQHDQPNASSTAEYQPILVHAGPFANIAVGQSSIIGDRVGSSSATITSRKADSAQISDLRSSGTSECRYSGMKPDASVLTATVRALKMHGNGPKVTPGVPFAGRIHEGKPQAVEAG
jgi:formate--tetrahydrofolate ligase